MLWTDWARRKKLMPLLVGVKALFWHDKPLLHKKSLLYNQKTFKNIKKNNYVAK